MVEGLETRSGSVRGRDPPILGTDNSPRYAELWCRSNFSFLQGASHPDELVAEAARLEYEALALTDQQSLAGVVRAHTAAKDAGLKFIVGAEIRPLDGAATVLWAADRTSYGRLARLLTVGQRRAPKGECYLRVADVAEHGHGLWAGVIAPTAEESLASLGAYREIFGDRLSLLGALQRGGEDRRKLARWKRIAVRQRLPLVAGGDVRFHVRRRRPLYDVLTAIRLGCTVAEAAPHLPPNAEHHLRSREEIARLWCDAPEALARSVEIAQACRFSLSELRYEYPEELAPPGLTPMEHLRRLTWEGAAGRYPRGIPDKVRGLVEHELGLIEQLRYEAYFLTVWDLIRFARSREILCQGRGSAANSAVCYCLGITSVDPERIDLLFERFVSPERDEAPDIDVDFEHERREEVLQYLYQKYGRERAGLVAEVITYRPRSAVRDVGKALGLSLERVDALAKNLDTYHQEPRLTERCAEAGLAPQSTLMAQLAWLVRELLGFPRHLSQHVGGMVMTRGALCELAPIQNAAMPDRTVIEWDKDDLDDLGILKVDCLALGMLTAIRKCFALVERHHGRRCTLANIPEGDPATYRMIRRADTIGVFQIESRAQMSMLPRLRPRNFYDLVIEVAIVRPGPIQGNMVHPFLRRRRGLEPVDYPNDAIREVLQKTLGVPIFQEQAMRLAVVAAGFTPGEADQLRRAMAGWRRPGLIESFHQKLISGMRERGLTPEYAERVFRQIRGFGEYGFPESHAASFALLAYVSAWLKCQYPAAFAAALINSQPMGFYAPAQLVRDAREHGVEVLPVDVNESVWDCTLEKADKDIRDESASWALRLGLRLIRGLTESDFAGIEAERLERGRFRCVEDFARRMRLSRAVLVRLAQGGAFQSLGARRETLWEALGESSHKWGIAVKGVQRLLPLEEVEDERRASGDQVETRESQPSLCRLADASNGGKASRSKLASRPSLPPMTLAEEVTADYQTAGLSLRAHPMSFVRDRLARRRVLVAANLFDAPTGRSVQVAGLVLLRQRPSTAKGITFVTLEDETGTVNVVVRADVWTKFRRAARHSRAMLVRGKVDRQARVVHVVATRIEDLSQWLAELGNRSRDFR